MNPRKFRKKPVIIEAIQWDGTEETYKKIHDWSNGQAYIGVEKMWSRVVPVLMIKTPTGETMVLKGDWVIKDKKGWLHSCGPRIFEQTYEPAEPEDFGEQ